MHVFAVGVFSADDTSNDVFGCVVDGDNPKIKSQTSSRRKKSSPFCPSFHCTPLNGNHTVDQHARLVLTRIRAGLII